MTTYVRAVSGATGFTTTPSRPRFFASGAGLATASSPFSVARALLILLRRWLRPRLRDGSEALPCVARVPALRSR